MLTAPLCPSRLCGEVRRAQVSPHRRDELRDSGQSLVVASAVCSAQRFPTTQAKSSQRKGAKIQRRKEMMMHSESIETRVHSFAPWQLCIFALKEMVFLFIAHLLATFQTRIVIARRRGHQTLVAAKLRTGAPARPGLETCPG